MHNNSGEGAIENAYADDGQYNQMKRGRERSNSDEAVEIVP